MAIHKTSKVLLIKLVSKSFLLNITSDLKILFMRTHWKKKKEQKLQYHIENLPLKKNWSVI